MSSGISTGPNFQMPMGRLASELLALDMSKRLLRIVPWLDQTVIGYLVADALTNQFLSTIQLCTRSSRLLSVGPRSMVKTSPPPVNLLSEMTIMLEGVPACPWSLTCCLKYWPPSMRLFETTSLFALPQRMLPSPLSTSVVSVNDEPKTAELIMPPLNEV